MAVSDVATLEPPVEAPAQSGPSLLDILSTEEGYQRIVKKLRIEPHPVLTMPTRQDCMAWVSNKGEVSFVEAIQKRAKAIYNEKTNPLYYGFESQQWKDADALVDRYRMVLVTGSRRCLGGETKIYDPKAGRFRRLDSIRGEFACFAWNGQGVVVAQALAPFVKEPQILSRFYLSNGLHFVASDTHLVLAPCGFVPIGTLSVGDWLSFPASNAEHVLSIHGVSGPHYAETTLGSLGSYRSLCRSCDESLHPEGGSDQGVFPLPNGVQTRTVYGALWRKGVQGNISSRIPDWLLGDHPSSRDGALLNVDNKEAVEFCFYDTPFQLTDQLSADRSVSTSRQYRRRSGHRPAIFSSALLDTEYAPVFSRTDDVPSDSGAQLIAIERLRYDEVWDFEVPLYHNYVCAGAIHHNSSKTEWRAKRLVQNFERQRGWKAWCLSLSAETSVRDQQQYVWKYLPYHWKKQYTERRNVARNKYTTMTYTQARGFGEGRVFTTPTEGECRFMNYTQDIKVLEGGSINEWWADEEIPPEWISQLRWRTIDRRGKGVITYTPQTGFTPTLAEFFTGATVLKSLNTPFSDFQSQRLWPGLPRGEVPYIMECLSGDAAVIFFQAFWNPYVPWDEFVKSLDGLVSHIRVLRAHGVTQKVSGSCFPRFGKHNIVSHEKVAEELKKGCTRYQIVDFAWNRNWYMLWLAVQRVGKNKKRIIVYREWPDFESYGEWVVTSKKSDGEQGPAQTPIGYGIEDYKTLIRQLECSGSVSDGSTASVSSGGPAEVIYARYGDPKSGASTALAEEGATSIFEMLDDNQPLNPPVEAVAGSEGSVHILNGVSIINQWLEYNTDEPITPLNEPMLYISDKCQNLIQCMKMWSGKDGDKGASKDPIDALRYAAIMDIDFHNPEAKTSYKGGSY